MAPPLIHIGYHRTATTWFQDRFYPAVANGVFVPRSLSRSAIIKPDAFSFSADEARSRIEEHVQGGRPLICEENLSGYLHNGGLKGLLSREVARRLKATYPDASIVVFLRSQPRMIAAAYAQYVKGGGTHSISRYAGGQRKVEGIAHHWYKAPRFSFEHFAYLPLLEDYAALFGRGNVHVYLYEEFARDPRAFARAFAERHGLDVDLEAIDWSPANTSLSPGEIGILRRLNLFTERSVPDKRVVLDLEDWYERRWVWLERLRRFAPARSAPLLTPKLEQKIQDLYAQSNAELARTWDLPLGDYGYPLPKAAKATALGGELHLEPVPDLDQRRA